MKKFLLIIRKKIDRKNMGYFNERNKINNKEE